MKPLFLACLFLMVSLGFQSCRDHEHEHSQDDRDDYDNGMHEDHDKSMAIFHPSPDPSRSDRPFSEVVQVGDYYFLSGKIGTNPTTGQLPEGGIQAETRQTLENIKAALVHHGLEMGDVIKALVVLDDMADFTAFNEVYVSYFPQKPARTTFAAESLALGARVEIEVLAYKSE